MTVGLPSSTCSSSTTWSSRFLIVTKEILRSVSAKAQASLEVTELLSSFEPGHEVAWCDQPENLSFVIGHDVGLSLEQKLQLLTISVERDRQKYLLQLLGGTR